MIKLEYKGEIYTIAELSVMSGIDAATLRDRLRRGYTVDEAVQIVPTVESVNEFCEASWYKDWIGMSSTYLYEIYWKWCISNGYNPVTQRGFTRHILKLNANLKLVVTHTDAGCVRLYRER